MISLTTNEAFELIRVFMYILIRVVHTISIYKLEGLNFSVIDGHTSEEETVAQAVEGCKQLCLLWYNSNRISHSLSLIELFMLFLNFFLEFVNHDK